MRLPVILACAAFTASAARSASLSAADREALLGNLEKLRETADSKVDARFRMAIAAYREAMASNDTAADFYLKCVGKVNFGDQQKKNSEFRDWKRKETDRLSDPRFRLALRYQLRWLVLTLIASSEKTKANSLATEALEIVESIFREIDHLDSRVLSEAVTSTVFAKAYEINKLGKGGWPLSPTQLGPIFEQVIFPPLRKPSTVDALRAAWVKRIQLEEIKVGGESGNNAPLSNNGGRKIGPATSSKPSPEGEKFITETRPELQWQMEMDLFRNGDESGAALKMFEHIKNHIDHPSSRNWTDQLKNLLTPPKTAAPANTSP